MTSSQTLSAAPHFSLNASELLAPFPATRYAFAYGSAALPQAAASAGSMLDLILVVDDPQAWHADNLERNPLHYSAMARVAGPALIARLQDSSFGARLWYNTLVSLPPSGRLVKYGVISSASFIADLLEWRDLYTAGRLHKPVSDLQQPPPAFAAALSANRRAALRSALLLLPPRFTARELFKTITLLSYSGDWRMTFGESPKKIDDIVDGAPVAFAGVFAPMLRDADFSQYVSAVSPTRTDLADPQANFEQDVSAETQAALGHWLPLRVQQEMASRAAKEGLVLGAATGQEAGRTASVIARARLLTDDGDGTSRAAAQRLEHSTLRAAADDARIASFWDSAVSRADSQLLPRLLRPTLSSIVAPAAAGQAIVGIFTAGPEKAGKYAAAKLRKFFRAVLRR
jgi:translocator assembly and maintenance protein 41